MTPQASAILDGRVRHRRHAPRVHRFAYRVWMTLLDLSEIEEVFRGRWFFSDKPFALARYRRADFLGPTSMPLADAVRLRVSERLGFEPSGAIELVTNLRIFGYRQNPVSFYFCYAGDGASPRALEAIVAEITNTPWGERHAYVLDARGQDTNRALQFAFGKEFHVSPFMPMEQNYDWRFHVRQDRIVVHMRNLVGEEAVFDATLDVRRRPITSGRIAWSLLRYPFQTGRIVIAIYMQALFLWLKGNRTHTHPDKRGSGGKTGDRARSEN